MILGTSADPGKDNVTYSEELQFGNWGVSSQITSPEASALVQGGYSPPPIPLAYASTFKHKQPPFNQQTYRK